MISSILNSLLSYSPSVLCRISVPSLVQYANLFKDCSSLEYINITVPEDTVSAITSYITGLSLSNLETLIINGEEVDLS